MININIDGTNYKCPTNWSEVTIKDYKRICYISKDLPELDVKQEIVHILTDIDLETIDILPMMEFNKLVNACSFVSKISGDIRYEITIDGVRYKMVNDITKVSTREYTDIDSIIKGNDYVDKLDIAMAILFRPIDSNGDPEPYRIISLYDRAELFNEKFPVDLMFAAVVFSTVLGQELLVHFLDSLEKSLT